jgi:hypothetical protein
MRPELTILVLHAVPVALQLVVPLVLLAWFARGRNAGVFQWLAKAIVVALYLSAVHFAGLWVVLPWYTAPVFATGLLGIALLQMSAVRLLPWKAARVGWVSVVVCGAIAAFAVGVLAATAMARRVPREPVVDLQFPLGNGVYYVAGGGSLELLNPHIMTLTAERFRPYRGQSYGVDLLKLGAYGLRASGWLSTDPTRYAIYGEPVHAPCSGTVVQIADGAPDMPPPQPDRTRIPGNHVLLDCDGVHVLLGHLQPGTVRVRRTERVSSGVVIGFVGNSGNSNEPHLHVHAQRPAPAGREPFSGDPLPMRFNGRYLVRNDRVTAD